MYLIVNTADGHIEEKNGSKYLIFASADENKEVLKKYAKLWDEIKYLIKTINGDKEGEYGKDVMKIKFNSFDDLSLNQPLKFHAMAIIIGSVFDKCGKYYPQMF